MGDTDSDRELQTAREGSLLERWKLSGAVDLRAEVASVLVFDPEPAIRASVLFLHDRLPVDVVRRVEELETDPSITVLIGRQHHASARAKANMPLFELSAESVKTACRELGLNKRQQRAVLKVRKARVQDNLLDRFGDVLATIIPTSPETPGTDVRPPREQA